MPRKYLWQFSRTRYLSVFLSVSLDMIWDERTQKKEERTSGRVKKMNVTHKIVDILLPHDIFIVNEHTCVHTCDILFVSIRVEIQSNPLKCEFAGDKTGYF